MKKTVLFFLAIALTLALSHCGERPSAGDNLQMIKGEAQGTTYSIRYVDSAVVTKASIDSLLDKIDASLSAWEAGSVVLDFNDADSIAISDSHFLTVYYRGRELSEMTGGAFHPMVMPLVEAWGFGPNGAKLNTDVNIDSLKKFVNYGFTEKPSETTEEVIFVKDHGYRIDVNGIAQGYTVDVLAEYLTSKGVEDYMIEVGGEVRALGKNQEGKTWRIGIDKPVTLEEERELQAIITLDNAALATSGSYRKFYEKDGKKYSHTIDPSSGKPVEHNLLSATVMADNCTNADALATAFMVMGVEGTKDFLAQHPEMKLEVYLIFDEDGKSKTYISEGLKRRIEEI